MSKLISFYKWDIVKQSTPSDTILAKLCELTGTKIYGDHLILGERRLFYKNTEIVKKAILDYYIKNKTIFYLDYDFCLLLGRFLERKDVREFANNPSQIDRDIRWFKEQFRGYPFFNFDLDNVEISEVEDLLNKQLNKENKVSLYCQLKNEQILSEDLFHEYSKFLRKEENKWEKISQVLSFLS